MLNNYSSFLIRFGLGVVFVLFGSDKLTQPEQWIVFLTPQITRFFPLSPYDFLKFQGVVEVLLGLAFFSGFMTRVVAGISATLLGLIVLFLWPDPVAIRDIGLLFSSLALVLGGSGKWSLDAYLSKGTS